MSTVVTTIKGLWAILILPIAIGLVFSFWTIVEYWPNSGHNQSAGPKALRVRG